MTSPFMHPMDPSHSMTEMRNAMQRRTPSGYIKLELAPFEEPSAFRATQIFHKWMAGILTAHVYALATRERDNYVRALREVEQTTSLLKDESLSPQQWIDILREEGISRALALVYMESAPVQTLARVIAVMTNREPRDVVMALRDQAPEYITVCARDTVSWRIGMWSTEIYHRLKPRWEDYGVPTDGLRNYSILFTDSDESVWAEHLKSLADFLAQYPKLNGLAVKLSPEETQVIVGDMPDILL